MMCWRNWILNRQNQLLEAIQERFQTLITTTHLGAFDSQWLKSLTDSFGKSREDLREPQRHRVRREFNVEIGTAQL